MHKWEKFLRLIVLIMIVFVVGIKFFPEVLQHVPEIIVIKGDQTANIIAVVNVVLVSFFSIYEIMDRKCSERVLFNIKIEEDDFNLGNYKSYSLGSDEFFAYVHYSANGDSDILRYGIPIVLAENPVCSVCIPLTIGVSTNLKGVRIELSDLTVVAKRNGRLIVKKDMGEKKFRINMPVTGEKTYVARMQLLCNHDMEAELVDGHIYVCFSVSFYEERGRVHKNFFLVNIQNVGGVCCSLLDVLYKSNYFAYLCETKKLVARH